jgi:hypothetical protein
MIPVSERISHGDPDARFYKKKNGEKSKLGYQIALATDIKEAIITRVITIPGCDNMSEAVKTLIEDKVVPELSLDGEFSIGELVSLAQDKGIILNVPMRNTREVDVYPKSMFQYDHELDAYKCPQGNFLKRSCSTRENSLYRGSKKVCSNCPVIDKCTKAKSQVRAIERSKYDFELELHEEYIQNDRYQLAKVLRGIIAEGKFFEANILHRLNSARYVGLNLMQAQAQMTAVVLNLKRFFRVLRKRSSLKNFEQIDSRHFVAS